MWHWNIKFYIFYALWSFFVWKNLLFILFKDFNNLNIYFLSLFEIPLLFSLALGSRFQLLLKKARLLIFYYRLPLPLKTPGSRLPVSSSPNSWLRGIVFRDFYRLPINWSNGFNSLYFFLLAPAPPKKAQIPALALQQCFKWIITPNVSSCS